MEGKNLYVISGCNGAGKTTASFTILPELLDCREFVNADEIAKGLSPFQPEKASVEAGRIMLQRIDELISENENFAFETTLATRSHKNRIIKAQNNGYLVTLVYFWLPTIELAKERVKIRVEEGGHKVDEEVIERRYIKGIRNLFDIYLPIIDGAIIVDNSERKTKLIANKAIDGILKVLDKDKYNELKSLYDND